PARCGQALAIRTVRQGQDRIRPGVRRHRLAGRGIPDLDLSLQPQSAVLCFTWVSAAATWRPSGPKAQSRVNQEGGVRPVGTFSPAGLDSGPTHSSAPVWMSQTRTSVWPPSVLGLPFT